ncbi:exported hypothetical protein [Vibrio chagasii]|nr:exported hypothetical protein [Vibrio chagasii]CAH6856274.1 exported hypothetical protein [Vibrio chagasii]CAH6861192.1 exported hypothetical protein [Vibrio chagasii]CAH7032334.1 exported hypothetical protein [Vibrio chagasii]CAH7118482.1 exported hypothetical protein [Vibrio chagasii]
MNMNKTILATLISTAFSSSVIAQSVNIELANLETEKVIQSQMDSIDSATLAKLNAQNSKVVALDGVVYEQDESGVWKAIGTGALGLTAALFSGSSSSSSNKLSDTPNYEQGAIKPSVDNKPGLPDVDNDIPRDINLIAHGDTAYMYVNGEEVRSATLGVTSKDNFTITGSEGATFHVTGNDVLVTMVNGESVKFHNVNRTDDRNISFSVKGENYNLHRTYSGEVWVQKEQGNGTGNWATIKTGADVLANIQERQLINAIDKTLPDVDNSPIKPEVDNKPGLPDIDNDIPRDINLITHGHTAYIYVNGEEVRTATLDVTSKDNFTITGSEGATFHVTGNDVLVTMVNGESIKLHNVNRTDARNISFSVEGENYNLHRTYSGEVWVQKEQGNGTGNWATIKTGADVLANIQERQLINAIDKTLPDVDNSPIKPEVDNKPGLPDVDNDIPRDINLITHGDTAYMYVNGEEVRTATLDVTSKDNFTITGSEGATFHVTGNDVLVTMVNGESIKLHNVNRTDARNISFSVEGENYNLHRTYSGEVWVQKEQGNGTGNWVTIKTGADVLANIQERQLINAIDKTLPEVDNSPILPEYNGGEGVQELKIVDGGIFLGEEKIGFIASDGNVNLYEHGKVGKAVYNGEGTLTAIKGDNGRELALRDDRITLVGDRGSVTMSRSDGSIRIDHNYEQAPVGFQIEEKAGSFHILDGEGNKVGHVKKEDGNIIKDGVGVIGSVAQIGNTGVYSFYNKSGDFVGNYTPSTGEIERPDSRNDIKTKLQSVDKSKLSNIKSRIQARFIK